MSIWDEMDDKVPGSSVESWIPENEGDTIAGVVTGFESGTSDYGDFDVIEIEVLDRKGKPTGEAKAIAMMGTVLQNAFERNRKAGKLRTGSEIAVRYNGMVQGKGPNKYKSYDMLCKPPSIAADMERTEPGEVQDGLPF